MVRELKGIDVLDLKGEKKGNIEVDISKLDISKSEKVISDVVLMYLSNQKKRNACVKGRGEVSYSNQKQRKQKGSGRSRAGSAASPIWVHGGVTFGPKPRDVYYSIPKKLKRKALKDIILMKVKNDEVCIVEDLNFDSTKTKNVSDLIKDLSLGIKVLFVLEENNKNFVLSSRNIPKISVKTIKDISALDVINSKKIVFTQNAFDIINKKLVA